jgi:rhamnosyltransferase
MKPTVNSVHAIVVTYKPNWNVLARELTLVEPQVNKIWVVDNHSRMDLLAFLQRLGFNDKLTLIQMNLNAGLGAAQNAGIEQSRKAGASHVLILDQDSQPMPNMVPKLLSAIIDLQSLNIQVAATAPAYADSTDGPPSGFVKLGWLGYKKQSGLSNRSYIEADFAISSGSLVPIGVLDDVGPMDAGLFIDHVDTEWCMRAQSKGYRLFGVPEARMIHTLGDKRKRIWYLRWRNVAFHSPFRYYYILRNSLLLQKRAYMPWKWRLAEMFRCVRVFVFFGLFAPNRTDCLRMMLKGVWHGLKGVTGPMPKP